MSDKLSKLDKEAEAAKAAFLEALNALDPLEVTWAFGMLADAAKDAIREAEENAMRHEHYGRKEKVAETLSRCGFYQKLIDLRGFWREAEMHHSAPGIVAAIIGRRP